MSARNDPPAQAVPVPAYESPKPVATRPWWVALGVSLLLLLLVLVLAPPLSSGSWWSAAIRAGAAAYVAIGAAGSFRATKLRLQADASVFAPALIAVTVIAVAFSVQRPTEEDWATRLQQEEAALIAGQRPEARAFLAGGGDVSAPLVESLYEAGARRVFAWDENDDGVADWIAVDMPFLPARRSRITSALITYARPDARFATPGSAQYWIVPLE